MNSTISRLSDKLSRPNSNIDINQLVTMLQMNDIKVQNKKPKSSQSDITLGNFCRLYQINHIAIIDFVIGYIILYVLNRLCCHYNYQLILLASIVFVIVINLLINPKVRSSIFWIAILLIAIYFMVKINKK